MGLGPEEAELTHVQSLPLHRALCKPRAETEAVVAGPGGAGVTSFACDVGSK